MSEAVQRVLLEHAVALAQPLVDAAGDPAALGRLLDAVGWDLVAAGGLTMADLDAAVTACVDGVEAARAVLLGPADDLLAMAGALAAVGEALTALEALGRSWTPVNGLPATLVETFVGDLVGELLDAYLASRLPRLRAVLALFGVVTRKPAPAIKRTDGVVVRRAKDRPVVDVALLQDFVGDPVGLLRKRYFAPGGTRLPAGSVADLLFPVVADALAEAGLPAAYGISGAAVAPDLSAAEKQAAAKMLTVVVPTPDDQPVGAALRVVAGFVDDGGALKLVVVPSGTLALTTGDGRWTFGAELSGTAAPVVIATSGVTFDGGGTAPALTARAEATLGKPASATPLLRLGAATGTRLQLKAVVVRAEATLKPGDLDAKASVELVGTKLVIAAGDGDGFLKMVLPAKPIEVDLDLALEWSGRDGWHLRGGAAIAVDVPLGLRVGPVGVPLAHVEIRPRPNCELAVVVSIDADLRLGPVAASVAGLGLRAALAPAKDGQGALGPVDVTLGVKPPDGVGLVIGAGPVSGGGFLFCDAEKGQYAGAMQLQAGVLTLKAVGLLNTKLPDGSPIPGVGFSLLVIISAEFSPIQLGFGFTLNGVGGILGVNRTVDVDVLREGVRSRALESVMFPSDPVANAPRIVSTLSSVFPVAPGRYVFGPMVRLGWGTPTLLTIDAGLVLELPAPVRLIILGRLRLALPREELPLVAINMDVLGVIDFDRGEASVDATLYDSSIAGFPLSGDMAMRARWSRDPTFAISAGGFHPSFTPPPGFPALRRMEIALAAGDNPRVRLQAYLAVTSNTAQFGARLDLYAAAAGFSIAGELAFDALLQFSPFRVQARLAGSVALRHGNDLLFSVMVEVNLVGPTPWHARGLARFTVLGFDAEVSFELTVGQALPSPPPAPVDVAGLLRTALADPRSWTAQLPPRGEGVVTFREVVPPAGTLLAHPLGGLSVQQRVVPLGVSIESYGSAGVTGERSFAIRKVRYGASTLTAPGEVVRDDFARGQFWKLSDADKLASPSFERFDAGWRVVSGGYTRDSDPSVRQRDLGHETIVVDDPDGEVPGVKVAPVPLSAPDLLLLMPAGAAAAAEPRRQGAARFAGPAVKLAVRDPRYVVAAPGEKPVAAQAGATYTGAREALAALARTNPDAARRVRVVPVRAAVTA